LFFRVGTRDVQFFILFLFGGEGEHGIDHHRLHDRAAVPEHPA